MLGEALRLIRVFHDMKQQELAEKLSLSKSYLSEVEGGKKVPSLDVVRKYSEVFGLPVSSIMFFAENIEDPTRVRKGKTVIAGKVLQFLQLVERKTDAEA